VEDELQTGTEGAERAQRPGEVPPLPPELVERQQEVRRLVDAGASSPEELRALAAKLQEQRLLEESAWKREVRPVLIESKKVRVSLGDLRPRLRASGANIGLTITIFASVILLLLFAAQTSIVWLLLPVAALLVYAWQQGRAPQAGDAPPATPVDPSD